MLRILRYVGPAETNSRDTCRQLQCVHRQVEDPTEWNMSPVDLGLDHVVLVLGI